MKKHEKTVNMISKKPIFTVSNMREILNYHLGEKYCDAAG